MVEKLILSYDYPAAYKMVENSNVFSLKFRELLNAACCRLKLEYSKTKTIFRKYGISIISDKNKNINDISEYLLLLKLKIHKEEYADFIRAITPVLVNLCSLYLKSRCDVDVTLYTEEIKEDFLLWKREKLDGTDILTYLDNKYGFLKDNSPLSSDSLIEIIYQKSHDSDVKLAVQNIRNVERDVRNSAAHTIVCITDKDIKSISSYSSKDIFDMLKRIFSSSGYSFDEKSYDKMNDIILEEL